MRRPPPRPRRRRWAPTPTPAGRGPSRSITATSSGTSRRSRAGTNQKQVLAWSAVSYTPTGAKEPALGTIKIEGPTTVSVDERVVKFDMKITEYNFKTLSPEQVKTLVADVQALPERERVLDLDRVTAAVAKSPLAVKNVEGIKADPPKVYWAPAPAALINLDGDADLEPGEGRGPALRGQHELGPLRAHADQDLLRALQRVVAAGNCRHRTVVGRLGQAARQLREAAGGRQLEGSEGRPSRQEALVEGDAEDLRHDHARRTDRPRGQHQLRRGRRRVDAAVGEQHRSGPLPHGPERRLLLPRRRPVVQGGEPGRAVDVRDPDAARGLQEDSGRASALPRARVGAGNAASHRSGAAGDDPAHGACQQEGAEGARRPVRRRQAARSSRSTAARVSRRS